MVARERATAIRYLIEEANKRKVYGAEKASPKRWDKQELAEIHKIRYDWILSNREGRSPLEVVYDMLMAQDGEAIVYFPSFNYAYGHLDHLREEFEHPRTMMSLVFQGGAAKYPDIRWIFSHSGGVTPFLLSRFERE